MKHVYKVTINSIDRHYSSKRKAMAYLNERYIVENGLDIRVQWGNVMAIIWDYTNARLLGEVTIIEVL